MQLNPKDFGLPPRTIVKHVDNRTFALVIKRKSRIIMVDGKKILEKIIKIKNVRPSMDVVLEIDAPICSKTRTYLEGEGIVIIEQSGTPLA